MGQVLSRRQLLRHAALVAATFPAARLALEGWSLPAEARAADGLAVPMNLELVTVTDTTAVMTWFTGDPTDLDEFGRPRPVAAPGRVLIGSTPNPASWIEVGSHEPTAYHHVEVTGLQPGARYWYRAESNGVPATGTTYDLASIHPLYSLMGAEAPSLGQVDPTNGLTFTTLVPPPGREVLRFAWFNDMHFGEQIAGIITGDLPTELFPNGFPPGLPVDPANPYWRVCGNAALAHAAAHGAEFLLVNGDLTNEAEPAALAEVKAALSRFGTVGGGRRNDAGDFLVSKGDAPAVWVTRGNHDRVHRGDLYRAGTPVPEDPTLRDTFYDAFRESFAPGSMSSRFTVVADSPTTRWRFVGIDSNDPIRGTGVINDEQLEYLEAKLGESDEPTFVLAHHPTSSEQQGFALNVPAIPQLAGVKPEHGGSAFTDVLSRHLDSVAGVYHGHTHRCHRSRDDRTARLPFYEGGSSKEYPVGYTMVRLYEGGYMVNFHKASDPDALAWSERSRAEYYGAAPWYLSGSLSDRNWVVEVDARRVTSTPSDPPVRPEPAPDPTPASPARSGSGRGSLPATGGPAVVTGLGALAAAAGAAARRSTADRDDG